MNEEGVDNELEPRGFFRLLRKIRSNFFLETSKYGSDISNLIRCILTNNS